MINILCVSDSVDMRMIVGVLHEETVKKKKARTMTILTLHSQGFISSV